MNEVQAPILQDGMMMDLKTLAATPIQSIVQQTGSIMDIPPETPVTAEEPKSALQEALEDPYAVMMQDFRQVQIEKLAKFDKEAWATGSGYEAPNFPMWNEKMEGLGNGFYIFAGFPNCGKTAYMLNLAMDYAKYEKNHLYLLYFTLDDSAQKLIPRIISMNKEIPISVSAKPRRYQEMIENGAEGSSVFQKMLEKRSEGLEELNMLSSHFLIQEQSDIQCAEKMLNLAKMYKTFVRMEDPKANLLVAVDSLMDINIDSANDRDEKERNTRISRMMKDWAENQLQCPVFGSAHLRKNTAGRRPQVSDLKESGRYEYDATAIFLIANDVSRSGQNADIYYSSPNDDEKHPVFEIQWAKNKASSFKERTYCFFTPEYSKATECSKELAAQFDAKIYSL